LYKITTILWNRSWSKNCPVRDKKGETLKGWEEQASGCSEHFSKMLNCDIPKEEENEELNVTHGENSGISAEEPTEAENILPEALNSDTETTEIVAPIICRYLG
jgi:hypothetical protein